MSLLYVYIPLLVLAVAWLIYEIKKRKKIPEKELDPTEFDDDDLEQEEKIELTEDEVEKEMGKNENS